MISTRPGRSPRQRPQIMTRVPGFNFFSTSSISGGPLSRHFNADTELVTSALRATGTRSDEPDEMAACADVVADVVCEIGALCFPGGVGRSIVLGGAGELTAPFVMFSATRSSVRAPPLIVLGGPAFFAISAFNDLFRPPWIVCHRR